MDDVQSVEPLLRKLEQRDISKYGTVARACPP